MVDAINPLDLFTMGLLPEITRDPGNFWREPGN